jgi:hypothetical protein
MRNRRLPTVLTLAVLAVTTLSLVPLWPASAGARSMALHAADVVSVSVNFNTQVPLADLSEETLATSQKAGRKFVYRLARDECAVLKAIIAKTCRLANLNISTQIQNYQNQNPIMLHVNGSANFVISLKDDEGQ